MPCSMAWSSRLGRRRGIMAQSATRAAPAREASPRWARGPRLHRPAHLGIARRIATRQVGLGLLALLVAVAGAGEDGCGGGCGAAVGGRAPGAWGWRGGAGGGAGGVWLIGARAGRRVRGVGARACGAGAVAASWGL